MTLFLKLFGIAMIPVVLSVIFSILEHTGFKKIPYWPKQIIIGVVFGAVAVFGTEYGVDIGGATANARDAAPLCAGLLFGGPAGIIAGFIGGVERWFAVYWGAGAYSRVACTVATCLSGLYAAFLRYRIFDRKRPDWVFGMATGVVMEVVHMTTLFLTHLSDAEQAFKIVKICSTPMILCNGVAVMLACIVVSALDRFYKTDRSEEGLKRREGTTGAGIARTIRLKLLVSIFVAFGLISGVTYALQTGIARNDVNNLLTLSLEDIKTEMVEVLSITENQVESAELLYGIAQGRHVGTAGHFVIRDNAGNIVGNGFGRGGEDIRAAVQQMDKIPEVNTLFEMTVSDNDYFCMIDYVGGYCVTAAVSKEEAYMTRDADIIFNSFMQVLVYACLFLIIYSFIRRNVVGSIYSVNESLHKIIDGNLDEKVEVFESAEFASLSNDINSTVATLKQYTIDAENRYKKELEFAKSIQHSVLPNVFPPFPDQHRFDVYATMDTAKEVGGDFYDFYMLGENKLVMTIADVSGKGVPAAMFMMTAKTTLRNLTMTGIPVEKVLEKASNSLCEGNDADMFVTCWLGILDLRSGVVTFANAGHNPPVIYRKGKEFEYLKQKVNLVLACVPDMEYERQTLTLEEGDRIYFYTDGVTEATSVADELYGEDRLKKYLDSHADLPAKDVLLGTKADIDAFAGEREQFDDITMMMVDYYTKETNGDKA